MTTLTEGRHAGGFIASEANGHRSRATVTLASGQVVKAGQVLGLIGGTAPEDIAVTVTAGSANTGTGALTPATPPTAAGVKAGVYLATCITKAANGGTFQVTDPAGAVVGVATVGAPFADEVKFTIADSDADFEIGDTFAIAVDISTDAIGGSYAAFEQDATDGSEVARAVAFDNADATDGAVDLVAMVRDCELAGVDLVWPADLEAGELATALRQLATPGVGIIVR